GYLEGGGTLPCACLLEELLGADAVGLAEKVSAYTLKAEKEKPGEARLFDSSTFWQPVPACRDSGITGQTCLDAYPALTHTFLTLSHIATGAILSLNRL
ncbi:MAG: hypothetical protein ACM3SW_05415, partial [Actinomycetota bacterium]